MLVIGNATNGWANLDFFLPALGESSKAVKKKKKKSHEYARQT